MFSQCSTRRRAINERWVRVNGIRTRYAEAGDGPPVVLVHGGGPGASWRAWQRFMPDLATHFRVIAVDMLGYGESDKPPLRYTEPRIARHLSDFVDTMDLEDISLVGNSKGAYWSARFMVDRPELIRRYVAVGSNTLAQAMGLPRIVTPGLRALEAYDGSDAGMRRFLEAILLTPPSEQLVRDRNRLANLPGAAEMRASLVAANKAMRSDSAEWQAFSLEHRLPALTLPMLMVWGQKDSFAPIEQAHEVVRLVPRMRLEILGNSGHQCQNDEPEAFSGLVLDFLLDRADSDH